MPPEQGFSSRELIAWIQEEVRESQRVKQAFLQECTETLAAICVAIWERLGGGGSCSFLETEAARRTRNTSPQSLSGATAANERRFQRWR